MCSENAGSERRPDGASVRRRRRRKKKKNAECEEEFGLRGGMKNAEKRTTFESGERNGRIHKRKNFPFQTPTFARNKNSVIRAQTRVKTLLLQIVQHTSLSAQHFPPKQHFFVRVRLGFSLQITTVRKNHSSQKKKPALNRLKIYFFRMQFYVQIFLQIRLHLSGNFRKKRFVSREENHIVHISTVPTNVQVLQREHIQIVQIDVRKQLARQISDWQSASLFRKKQTFGFWHSHPILLLSLDDAIFRRIIPYDFFHETKKHPLVERQLGAKPFENVLNFLQKNALVNRHEISRDVEFQHICLTRIILRNGSREMIGSGNTERRSPPLSTAVTVIYKQTLAKRIKVVKNKVMDDAVSKIPRKYLAPNGKSADKTDTRRHFVCSRNDFVAQPHQLPLVIHFESDASRRQAFMPSCFKVGEKKIVKKCRFHTVFLSRGNLFPREKIHESLRQRTEKPFAFELRLRFTPEDPELRLRFHALTPEEEDDQKFVFEDRLLNVPSVLRLPERDAKIITVTLLRPRFRARKMGYRIPNPRSCSRREGIIGLVWYARVLHWQHTTPTIQKVYPTRNF